MELVGSESCLKFGSYAGLWRRKSICIITHLPCFSPRSLEERRCVPCFLQLEAWNGYNYPHFIILSEVKVVLMGRFWGLYGSHTIMKGNAAVSKMNGNHSWGYKDGWIRQLVALGIFGLHTLIFFLEIPYCKGNGSCSVWTKTDFWVGNCLLTGTWEKSNIPLIWVVFDLPKWISGFSNKPNSLAASTKLCLATVKIECSVLSVPVAIQHLPAEVAYVPSNVCVITVASR